MKNAAKKVTSVLNYVLVTPARNEASFIEETILSVVRQTHLPLRWVIVSDGSTDDTDSIVLIYAVQYAWIQFARVPERKERNFAGKVHAFNAGYEKVKSLRYDVIGSLDADVSFEPSYVDYILQKFAENPKLGVAGTPFIEGTVTYDYRFSRKEHVSGACQLFRRECFESIGGYIPIKEGAIDLAAVVTARMKGWRTETFTEKTCVHQRRMGTAKYGLVSAALRSGYGDYRMGVHFLWQLFRSIYQMGRKPVFLMGSSLLTGYLWAFITHARKPVSPEFVNFRKKEQITWLKEFIEKSFHSRLGLTK